MKCKIRFIKPPANPVCDSVLQKREKISPSRRFHILSILIFSLYLSLLVWLILLKCNIKITITDTYYLFGCMTWSEKLEFAKNSFLSLFKANTWLSFFRNPRQDLLNIVAFLPFGIYLGYFTKKHKLPKTVLASFLLSFFFESMQLVSHIGCFSAMDLVTNTLGGTLGFLIYKLIYKDTSKRIGILTIVSYIFLAVVVFLVCYALIKTTMMLGFYFDVLWRRL